MPFLPITNNVLEIIFFKSKYWKFIMMRRGSCPSEKTFIIRPVSVTDNLRGDIIDNI